MDLSAPTRREVDRRMSSDGGDGLMAILALGNATDIISFAGGFPDPATFPGPMLADIFQRLVSSGDTSALQYARVAGLPGPRNILTDRLEAREGYRPSADELMITSGTIESYLARACSIQMISRWSKVLPPRSDHGFPELRSARSRRADGFGWSRRGTNRGHAAATAPRHERWVPAQYRLRAYEQRDPAPSQQDAAGSCKQCAVVRLEGWPFHLAVEDVKLVAENHDLDLLGIIGPQGKDDELKKATQHPIAERQDDEVARLGFMSDGGYGILQSVTAAGARYLINEGRWSFRHPHDEPVNRLTLPRVGIRVAEIAANGLRSLPTSRAIAATDQPLSFRLRTSTNSSHDSIRVGPPSG